MPSRNRRTQKPNSKSCDSLLRSVKGITHVRMLTEDICLYMERLQLPDPQKRWFAARTLGSLGGLQNGGLRRQVLQRLRTISRRDVDPYVRIAARFAIQEIQGKLAKTSEKYNPNQPLGYADEVYYLMRG